MLRYRAFWSIPNAGPSVSTFFLNDAGTPDRDAAAAALRAFFLNRAPLLPNEVTISFDTAMDVIDEATGNLTGSYSVTAPATVTGSGAGVWAAGSGVRIDWLTPGFRNGRRVRGRTFMVPAAGGAFGTDGRVLPAQVAATNAAASTLISALIDAEAQMVIWARPGTGGAGDSYPVDDPATSSLAATLRGRKY